MNSASRLIGATPYHPPASPATGEYVTLLGETYYKIGNYDAIEPFFISLVSSSDHWLFIASTGGLSAGRESAEKALFPYYNVDRLTEDYENTGSKTILWVSRAEHTSLWEPFSERGRGAYVVRRNLYKNIPGTALVFEEQNLDLGLTCRYAWRTSEKFGFIKTTWLVNDGDSPCRVDLLDGLQNLLPASVSTQTQNTFSSLLDAYKRSELHPAAGLGIFALNATLTDLAEPSESLLATTAFQLGLDQPDVLLSSLQLDRFRAGLPIETEAEVRGRRGAYFVHAALDLAPGETCSWHLAADVEQDAAAVVAKLHFLQGGAGQAIRLLEADIAAGQAALWKIVAAADGLQLTNHPLVTAHHFANVLFNLMRGGAFIDQYWVRLVDFRDFVALRNRPALARHAAFFAALPDHLRIADLIRRAELTASADLLRLAYSYLPLTFSRRHGDPSRPWNRFTIQIKNPDGSQKIDYEGNWRDIFQNWEALACSFPEFTESMIATFLNATTVDGYNPYRITHRGLDWETPQPGNPWANLGYWSDHQVIYLQKLMELSARLHPGKLADFLDRRIFSSAHVPYRLKPYADILNDPYNTIDFDWELERAIDARQEALGADGKLVLDVGGSVRMASLAEKLLTILLAKLANFVPEGGIWMITQRPEWNDANNALVGKGLSVVTLCYLRRYLAFCRDLFAASEPAPLHLSVEISGFYTRMDAILRRFEPLLSASFSDEQRRSMMDELGQAGSDFRQNFYQQGLSDELAETTPADLAAFFERALRFVEHSLRHNRRPDALYHAYNILHLDAGGAAITRLPVMLEGQVAILSSGLLSAQEAIDLLASLRHSALYQPETASYILYPDRTLPGFLHKNSLSAQQIGEIALLQQLVASGDRSLLTRDRLGRYHFSGGIRNFKDVTRLLDHLRQDPQYAPLVDAGREKIRALFEDTFHHDEFTGRSGAFFAYEGLGSVYWHMIAKLLLAVQENALRFQDGPAGPGFVASYFDIRQGLGFNKSPAAYGAFPTDPYSHTPKGQGAKQPGMTGMVKEELLTRQAELGFSFAGGALHFDSLLLDHAELLAASAVFHYLDVNGERQAINVAAGALAFTLCGTPVIVQTGPPGIAVHLNDGSVRRLDATTLDAATSRLIFHRDGAVHHLVVTLAN